MHLIHTSAVLAALVLFGAESRTSDAASTVLALRIVEPDACSLLTEADVSKALEVKSLPGKRIVAESPKACAWSDDAEGAFSHRRATAQYISVSGFQFVKSRAGHITIEPVSGIGDEAYYEISKTATAILAVRKGNVAIQVRVLNGLKFKAFTLEQEKAKEADLAKAAVARL
jgi:hypothetical protein